MIAHAKLHAPAVGDAGASQGNCPDRHTQEVEAEAWPMWCASILELTLRRYSFGYVAWSSGKDARGAEGVPGTIRQTASTDFRYHRPSPTAADEPWVLRTGPAGRRKSPQTGPVSVNHGKSARRGAGNKEVKRDETGDFTVKDQPDCNLLLQRRWGAGRLRAASCFFGLEPPVRPCLRKVEAPTDAELPA